MSASPLAKELINKLIGSNADDMLDGTKLRWYADRVRAWERGERIAPVTIDMALTTTCNAGCEFCYRFLQKNENHKIKTEHMTAFLDDCAEIGVKGVSLVSDGESSISPCYAHTISHGHSLGLSIASGTNAYLLRGDLLEEVFPKLTYLRVNISAGEQERYDEIMGTKGKPDFFSQVCQNIRDMVRMKKAGLSQCTVGMQMVFKPDYEDQLIPLAKLAVELEADYLVIKHCSDDEFGTLGVKYGDYERTYPTLLAAQSLSNDRTRIQVKWSKINECTANGAVRTYQRCYGAPFLLQISGTGLVAPCGMLFNERYKEWAHMGNITQQRFKDIWQSEKYWQTMKYLASEQFNAQQMCGSLCLQHSLNKALDFYKKGNFKLDDIEPKKGEMPPEHLSFI
jgi:MoaA/NifB/PqqE/SkfB family radical SAM enzyme